MTEKTDLFISSVVRWFSSLIKVRITEEKILVLVQFVKFCMVGITNTALSYAVNVLVLFLLKPYYLRLDYIAGNVTAFVLSVLWSFYWNNKYVFVSKNRKNRNTLKSLLKTYISYAFTGLFLSTVFSYLFIEKIGISKFIVPLLNLIISVPINFIINKFWAFKD